MTAIAIQKFEAEYKTIEGFRPCEVIGVDVDSEEFIIITDGGDGRLWTSRVQTVRKPEPWQPKRPSA